VNAVGYNVKLFLVPLLFEVKKRKSKFNGFKDEEVEPLTAFRVFSEELDLSS
jgi:hypothetical protein